MHNPPPLSLPGFLIRSTGPLYLDKDRHREAAGSTRGVEHHLIPEGRRGHTTVSVPKECCKYLKLGMWVCRYVCTVCMYGTYSTYSTEYPQVPYLVRKLCWLQAVGHTTPTVITLDYTYNTTSPKNPDQVLVPHILYYLDDLRGIQ